MSDKATIPIEGRPSGLTLGEGNYIGPVNQSNGANRYTVSLIGIGSNSCEDKPENTKLVEPKANHNEHLASINTLKATLATPSRSVIGLKRLSLLDNRVRIFSDTLGSLRSIPREQSPEEIAASKRRSVSFPTSRQRGFRRLICTASLSHSRRSNAKDPTTAFAESSKPQNPLTASINSARSRTSGARKSVDRNILGDSTVVTGGPPGSNSIPTRNNPLDKPPSGLTDPELVIEKGNQKASESEHNSCRNDMAAGFQRMSGDARRYPSSNLNRSENRPPMNNVLCRNGPQCRKFQEG